MIIKFLLLFLADGVLWVCCRSFEIPKRDSEKEVERKAKARKAREERRSTQVGLHS